MTIRVIYGDCLIELPKLAAAGERFHAVVTDPPYELSNDGKASPSRVAAEMLFPKHANVKTAFGGECELGLLVTKIAELRSVRRTPRPSATVPIGAVALNQDAPCRQVDIEDVSECAVAVAGRDAASCSDAEAVEHLGDFVLKLGDCFASCDALNRVGCCFDSGGLGIGFRVGAARLPSLLACCFPVIFCDDDIGLADDAPTSSVSTRRATEDEAVARFNLGSAAEDSLSASAALMLLAVAQLAGAQLVRADPGTSRLPAMLETRKLRVIGGSANRTITFNLLIHRQNIESKGFMNKSWDGSKVTFDVATWRAVYDCLLPGAHLLAFGGTRTFHRLVCAIEDAGFEIRDTVAWLYGSGFPKSLDVSKAIDRAAGAEREVVGQHERTDPRKGKVGFRNLDGDNVAAGNIPLTAPATDAAKQWAGWGTALKPAFEPIVVARKPLDGTVAANVLKYGCGALNIDASRIPTDAAVDDARLGGAGTFRTDKAAKNVYKGGYAGIDVQSSPLGRFPANVVHDGGEEVLAAFAAYGTSGEKARVLNRNGARASDGWGLASKSTGVVHGDSGTVARFFYSSKADRADRADSKHPTVKPVDLIRWLVTLACPPGGHVLDCFAGSGTTGEACMLAGFDCTLIEREAEHARDIKHRIKRWSGLDAPLFAT